MLRFNRRNKTLPHTRLDDRARASDRQESRRPKITKATSASERLEGDWLTGVVLSGIWNSVLRSFRGLSITEGARKGGGENESGNNRLTNVCKRTPEYFRRPETRQDQPITTSERQPEHLSSQTPKFYSPRIQILLVPPGRRRFQPNSRS